MQKKNLSMEVKVGALFLFSVALLVVFVLLLGDFSFSKGFTFYDEFDNAGGLKPGGDVAIAGIDVGKIQELRFLRNKQANGPDASAVAVRVKLRIDQKYADAVRTNSAFYITTRGVLGEPYIEVVTKDFDSPPIAKGAVLRGVDPPRMDLIVARASELLSTLTELLNDPNIHARDLLANSASLVKHLDEFVVDNRKDLDSTVSNVRDTSKEAAQLLGSLNVAVDDGSDLRRTVTDIRSTAHNANVITSRVGRDIDPLVDDVTATAHSARNISASADRLVAGNEQKINTTVADVQTSAHHLATISGDAQHVVHQIRQGKGTVGALIADREIYDNLREMLRIIKQRPWKMVWKE